MMTYSTFVPDPRLKPFVKCYWIVEGIDQSKQKIVPDGFSELIFHFQDPYEISTSHKTEVQPLTLVAGQLHSPIFLRPTGRSGVMGIKFTATGMWRMFRFPMRELVNQAIPIHDLLKDQIRSISDQLHFAVSNDQRIQIIEKLLFEKLNEAMGDESVVDLVIRGIVKDKGTTNILKLALQHKVSLRKLERLFNQQVGISAKLYARLVRFNHVFSLIQTPTLTRSDVTFLGGYFDQSHFNREFKEFSGENPESWTRQNHAFSKFFLTTT
jgi:AraC-like DNA-binding protein